MTVIFFHGEARAVAFSDKAAKLSAVTGLRVGVSEDRVRIVVDTNREVDYSVMVLSDPSRVVVDLSGAWISSNVLKERIIDSPFASKVRLAQFNENTVRIVVESAMGKGKYDVFSIEM